MLFETITCYCICDDLLKAMGYKDDPQCRMGSAEVMTVGLVAAFYLRIGGQPGLKAAPLL